MNKRKLDIIRKNNDAYLRENLLSDDIEKIRECIGYLFCEVEKLKSHKCKCNG